MADLTLPVDLGSIVGPNCYQNRDADAIKVAAAMSVTIPSVYVSWITQETTPSVDDRDKNWLRLDSNGNPIEALAWSTAAGAWVHWFSLNKFASVSGGAANAYTSTYTPALTATDMATGSVFIFVASFANTGAATWSPNGLGPYPLTKNGTVALVANDIVANQIVVGVFDGTNLQIVSQSGNSEILVTNIAPGTVGQVLATLAGPVAGWRDLFNSSTVYNAATIAANQSFAHGLPAAPGYLQLRWKCNTPDIGYVAGEEVPGELTYLLAASGQKFSVYADATNIYILTAAAVTATMTDSDTSAHNATPTLASWDLYVRYA